MYFYKRHLLLPLAQLPTPTVPSFKSLLSVTQKTMKQTLHYSVVLLLLLLFVLPSKSSARFLASKQGSPEGLNLNGTTSEGFLEHMESSTESMNELLGLEICNNGDEECLKRRIIAEAHLDYIYTQHHKP